MKRQGSKFEHTAERDKELMKTYCHYLGACDEAKLDVILTQTVNTPCSRFWVSDERASIVMSGIEREAIDLTTMVESRRNMYLELYRRVQLLRNENPTMSLSEVTSMAVMQEAPCFYLTAKSARTIIHRIKTKWRISKKRPF